ncbi:hypothetical protein [Sphingopyxis sp.]|jgi:hypothetical protein|uniref:hypothetical protein n=1 Tax=Sphingopyxis sp. TaxID=1908224 RepID=UPI003F72FB6A
MNPRITAIIAAAAVAAMPAAAPAMERLAPEDRLAKLLEGRVAGQPQDCIPLSMARSSQVIDGTAIVYRIGSTLWVNRPEGGADSLDDDDILITKLSTSQLCSIDTIQLQDRGSNMYSGFVSLGKFVPYRRVKGE